MKLLISLALLLAFSTYAYDEWDDSEESYDDYGTYEEEMQQEEEILDAPQEEIKTPEKVKKATPKKETVIRPAPKKKKQRKIKSGARETKSRGNKPVNIESNWQRMQKSKETPKYKKKRPRRKRRNSGERI